MSEAIQHLTSWKDTATRSAIVSFVEATVTPGGPGFVAPEERVAVFDNDGTLWCEKPMPIQLDFTIRRFAEQAQADASLRDRQPYKAALEQDTHWLGQAMIKHYHGDDSDMALLQDAVGASFVDVPVEDYIAHVAAFFQTASHPTLGRPYLDCAYTPMIELLRYLEAHGYATYIASGGDRDFMRVVARDLYGIPPERVVGSSLTLDCQSDAAGATVLYKAGVEFFDDGPTKPVRIWSRIGRRPILAVGNSNGDREMLRFTGHGPSQGLRMLLLHDDADREFDYTAGAETVLDEAKNNHSTIISMRDDWSTVFGAKD